MLKPNEVTGLHLELTSKCSLNCLHCARTDQHTFKKLKDLPSKNLDPKILDNLLKELSNVKILHYCGNYGDFTSYNKIFEIAEISKKHKIELLRMYTHGSSRNPAYWKKLAKEIKGFGEIIFSIDGLEDTNKIYRVNSNFEKIIENAENFIKEGGNAVWEMLVFEHNEHQVEQVKNLSKKLGFKEFRIKKPNRFHLLHTKVVKQTNNQKFQEVIKKSKTINCRYKQYKWLYLSFEGELFPCCWMGGYKYKTNQQSNEFYHFYKNNEGDNLSLYKNTAKEILKGKFFNQLQNSWLDKSDYTNTILLNNYKKIIKNNELHINKNYLQYVGELQPLNVCSNKCKNVNTIEDKYVTTI